MSATGSHTPLMPHTAESSLKRKRSDVPAIEPEEGEIVATPAE